MKRIIPLLFVVLMAACGDDDSNAARPRRIVSPGALLLGPVGGSDLISFEDGSRVRIAVSGTMVVGTPGGVFLGTAFPAEVTFSVRSVNGEVFEERIEFPRILISGTGAFEGAVSTETVQAVMVGMFKPMTDGTLLDVQAFSFALPTTFSAVESRTLLLQGPALRERALEPLP